MMRTEIKNQTFDAERSLYNLSHTDVVNCNFGGPADGESVLKECRDVKVAGCKFSLRYPLWHAEGFVLDGSKMDENTRAPLWYCAGGVISECGIDGIKTLRECKDVSVFKSRINSPEFGWRCDNVLISDCDIQSVYFLFESKNVSLRRVTFLGKYSFQYVENLTIEDSYLDTKDAFWHAKNVTVKNSVVKGEYLGWFSENLTFINCKIIGTQPLCYCKNLTLINCTTEDCDLSFEYSDVQAEIKGGIVSIKNPKSGVIKVGSVGEIVESDAVMQCEAEIIVTGVNEENVETDTLFEGETTQGDTVENGEICFVANEPITDGESFSDNENAEEKRYKRYGKTTVFRVGRSESQFARETLIRIRKGDSEQ